MCYADKLPRQPTNSGTTKARQAAEASLRQWYPPNDLATGDPISKPCIIVDMQGIILAWYLPGILKDSQQVSLLALSDCRIKCIWFQREMMAATEKFHPLLGRHQGDSSWHNNAAIYCPGTEGPQGLLNLSPVWFQQGHEVISLGMWILMIGSWFQLRWYKNPHRLAMLSKSLKAWNG